MTPKTPQPSPRAMAIAKKIKRDVYEFDETILEIALAIEAYADERLDALDAKVCEIQLAVANSDGKLLPDIKRGHWIACHAVRSAIRALQRGGGW